MNGKRTSRRVSRRADRDEALESRGAYAYAAVDLTPAYRATRHPVLDNPAVVRVEREHLFVRSLETLLVFDRVESTSGSQPKLFLAQLRDRARRGRCIAHGHGHQRPQAMRMTTLVPAAPTYRPVVNEGGPVGQFRVEVETSGSAQSNFLHALQAPPTRTWRRRWSTIPAPPSR